ncbi:hypothetical protein ACFXHA_45405 [Nocardia sp. NPDC059240]|uniref:hypothetical protein n=1 Tax=Nocardia sp. NPDC059240 TaxID=3346786 RepID=UPI0036B24A62
MVEQRCQLYQSYFELEAFRDPARGDIRVATGPTTAGLIVPRELAVKAATLLEPGSVPVYCVGRAVWVFVTGGVPDGFSPRRLSISLFWCGVVPVLSPSVLVLPTPGVRRRCWMSVPYGPTRPPIREVAAAIIRATTV